MKDSLNKVKNWGMKSKDKAQAKVGEASALIGAFSADDISEYFTKYYSDIVDKFAKAKASAYDKALDATYIETKLGGKYHRLFDQGHDIFDAWEKVKSAKPDDSSFEEIVGFASAFTKDFVTKMGMPLKSIDKETFDVLVDKLSIIPGLDREYLYDALTVNAAELTASAVGALGIFFAFKKDDYEQFSEIIGAMGISSVVSANPITGIVSLVAAAYAYKKNKIKSGKLAIGAGMSAVSISLFTIMGLPLLVEIVIVMIVSHSLKKNLFEDEAIRQGIKKKFSKLNIKELKEALGGFTSDFQNKLFEKFKGVA